jgi:hypothetical protein
MRRRIRTFGSEWVRLAVLSSPLCDLFHCLFSQYTGHDDLEDSCGSELLYFLQVFRKTLFDGSPVLPHKIPHGSQSRRICSFEWPFMKTKAKQCRYHHALDLLRSYKLIYWNDVHYNMFGISAVYRVDFFYSWEAEVASFRMLSNRRNSNSPHGNVASAYTNCALQSRNLDDLKLHLGS